MVYHMQFVKRAAVGKRGNIFCNLRRRVAVYGLADDGSDGIAVCPAGSARACVRVERFDSPFLIIRRCHCRPVFVQLQSGEGIQSECCHVFVQRRDGFYRAAVFGIAHAVSQFVKEVVAGNLKRVCHCEAAMIAACVAVNPAAGIWKACIGENTLILNNGVLGDCSGFQPGQRGNHFEC